MAESRAAARLARVEQRLDAALGRVLPRQSAVLIGLTVVAVATSLGVAFASDVTPEVMLIPISLAQLFLGPRYLSPFIGACLAALAVSVAVGGEYDTRQLVSVLIVFLLGALFITISVRGARAGVASLRGEAMLVDLRDRIQGNSDLTGLPRDWQVQSELRTAGGTPFAGDFVVTALRGHRLDLVVVDVSGKGEEAGTRALLLTGAFRGLIGAVPPDQFLVEANSFLVREDWEEGFATAVHLSVDLRTGRFELRSAGHPPAASWHAGSGRWEVLSASGPLLGLMDDVDFEVLSGELRRGDALLLFTDGLVESRQLDITMGIDRLMGAAERQLRGSFAGGAATLIDRLGSGHDDRALVVVHRL